MKTTYKRALTILLLLLTCVMLSSATKSPYYSKSVIITKVYPHKMGYRVLYLSNDLKIKEVYLKSSLFEQQKSIDLERSRIFKGYNEAYPYLTIFWKDGVFDHVKLYLKTDYADPTWGVLTNPDSYDEIFKNAEVKFDF